MLTPFYVVLAAAGGAILPVQGAINAQLSRVLGHPMWAGSMSSVVTLSALLILGLVLRAPAPVFDKALAAPWWVLLGGGLVGAYGVFAILFFTPLLGATAMVAALLLGQVLASVVLDQYGLFGLTQEHIFPNDEARVERIWFEKVFLQPTRLDR